MDAGLMEMPNDVNQPQQIKEPVAGGPGALIGAAIDQSSQRRAVSQYQQRAAQFLNEVAANLSRTDIDYGMKDYMKDAAMHGVLGSPLVKAYAPVVQEVDQRRLLDVRTKRAANFLASPQGSMSPQLIQNQQTGVQTSPEGAPGPERYQMSPTLESPDQAKQRWLSGAVASGASNIGTKDNLAGEYFTNEQNTQQRTLDIHKARLDLAKTVVSKLGDQQQLDVKPIMDLLQVEGGDLSVQSTGKPFVRRSEHFGTSGSAKSPADQAKDRLIKIEGQMTQLTSQYTAGLVTPEVYKAQMGVLTNNHESAKGEVKRLDPMYGTDVPQPGANTQQGGGHFVDQPDGTREWVEE
jgi:hypothetical protein